MRLERIHLARPLHKATRAALGASCLGIFFSLRWFVVVVPFKSTRSSNLVNNADEQLVHASTRSDTGFLGNGLELQAAGLHQVGKDVYSSFRCMGGSQTFPGMDLHHSLHVYQGWPEANINLNRVCLFENICWLDDQFVFFEDPALKSTTPAFLWPDAFAEEMLSTGQNPLLWSPGTRLSPLPQRLPLLSNVTFMLNGNSNSDNFAHLLVDDLIPSLAALSLFGLPLDSGQLLSQYGCRESMAYYKPDDLNPITHRSRSEVCRENFDQYTPLILGRRVVDLTDEWKGRTVCVTQLIAGQSSLFSLRTLDVERGLSLRTARDLIVERLGLGSVPRPAIHNVMVLLKQPSFDSPTWSALCEDTRALVQAINPAIAIRCFNPVTQTIEEQVRESLQSSLIVTEHGATSYGALYGHDGVVLLSIATRKEVKDTHIHLYASHYETYYFASEDKKTTFKGMLHFTLAKSAANFGFDANCTGLCAQ